ncbi:hypothetical protein [Streptomyces graminilatus]|uniref:hypothetical protein n=1 Tax=Streptomyces graminilatus TaxID=1464070 RepID=UPI0006E11FD1|nr:hypothetical protein [Streptomyces graminilatus]
MDRVLRKVGSERPAERAGATRLLRDSAYDMTGILRKIVHHTLINGIVAWLPRGIVAVVLIVVTISMTIAVRGIVGGALSAVSYGRTVATISWARILALGVIAALGRAGIARHVTRPVLYAALAVVVGILVGGGMIAPTRRRWERMPTEFERETVTAKGSAGAYRAGRDGALTNEPVQERTDPPPRTTDM